MDMNDALRKEIHEPGYEDAKTPLLTWWNGIYDHVFVALHPFWKVDPENGPHCIYPAPETDIEDRGKAWSEFLAALKVYARPVTWKSIHEAVAPEEPREKVYRTILVETSGGYKAHLLDKALSKRIANYCEPRNIFWPWEDEMPPHLEPTVGKFLEAAGHRSVTVWNEFRDYSETVDVSVFAEGKPAFCLPAHAVSNGVWVISAPSKNLLMVWQYDGAHVLIAMTDEALQQVQPEDFFEGWYADEKTLTYPLLFQDFFERKEAAVSSGGNGE